MRRGLILRGLVLGVVVGLLMTAAPMRAQSPPRLLALVTDQTPLALSNQFGPVSSGTVNEAGDYAFIVNSTALFFRRAGAPAAVRVIQAGDALPGEPGSRAAAILNAPRINASGLMVFALDLVTAAGQEQSYIGAFDGTTVRKIVAGSDVAPGTGGARFERSLSLAGLNDAGDVLLRSDLIPSATTIASRPTLFLVPSGGVPVRLVGFGDSAPGTGGTFSNVSGSALNNLGESLVTGTITGGTAGTGLFIATTASIRKVVASGDANPLGGVFPTPIAGLLGRLNNSGEVAFAAGNSLWVDSPGAGTSLRVATGSLAPSPAPAGATFDATIVPVAFNDAGDIAFTNSIRIPTVFSPLPGIFRSRAGLPATTEVVVLSGDPLLPTALGSFSAISMNNVGTIAFLFFAQPGSSGPSGIFWRSVGGSLAVLAQDGHTSPLGGAYNFATTALTQVTAAGSVYVQADLPGAAANYGEFLLSAGSATTLMSTADPLPAGGHTVLWTRWLDAAGDYVAFRAMSGGGRASYVVHNATTHATTVLVTDGDPAPGTGGGVLSFTSEIIFVGAGGDIAFEARVIGGSTPVRAGIFTARVGAGVSKIAVVGDGDSAGRVLTSVDMNSLSPSPVDGAGEVIFVAARPFQGTGLYLGGAGASPVALAGTGDLTSNGRTFVGFSTPLSRNASGHVAFRATTAFFGSGLFVVVPGSMAVKVAQLADPAPGGGTFSVFSAPSFNNSGDLVFGASVTGGSGGGLFLASATTAPVALALNGQAAPGGGAYSITSARPDAVINDAGDISFLADLTGVAAGSGYFLRRGPAGSIVPVVLVGQPAPGTAGTFTRFAHTANLAPGEYNQLSSSGDAAFLGRYLDAGVSLPGYWHVRTDNTVGEILVRGVAAPEFGGGQAVAGGIKSSWMTGGRYPGWVGISGGTIREGIFLFTADTDAPIVNCGVADGLWHAADVTVSCTASDAGTGLADAADASFSLTTSVAAGSETSVAATNSRIVCDKAGNCATAGPVGGHMIDRRPPTVTITAPSGAALLLGQVIASSYGCVDGGSGVVSCSGPVASGSPINTSTVGSHTFDVSSSDAVGNAGTGSIAYAVAYAVAVLTSPKEYKAGSMIPIRLQLRNASGGSVSSASIPVVTTSIHNVSTSVAVPPTAWGSANPGGVFRFDSGAYVFNLSLKSFTPGTYALAFTAGNDPTTHTVQFQVK